MKLILGLGNPGEKYKNTRHNVGFLFLDFLKDRQWFEEFSLEKKFFGKVSNGVFGKEKVLLLKPETFMNLSGKSLRVVLDFFKISSKDFLVIYDDKDLEFGKIRYREKGSSGGHNGIKDLIKVLGTEEFSRIKIGVKDEENLQFFDTADFVLSNFSEEELEKLPGIFEEVEKSLKNQN